MPFPFMKLPVELAREIVNHATTATGQVLDTEARNEVYKTACALARVSEFLRTITMPNLLHTVVLSSQDEVMLFIQALEMQQDFSAVGSKLQLNYQTLVHRFWSSDFSQPIQETQLPEDINYRPLHNILRKVENLGFHFDSIHLLAEVLELNVAVGPWRAPTWRVTRITLAGDPRWAQLKSSQAGSLFLHNLTHLTLWGPVNRSSHLQSTSRSQRYSKYQVPDWVSNVPFKLMTNLTHFSHTLINLKNTKTIPIIAYIRPEPPKSSRTQEKQNGGLNIEKRVKSTDPLSYGHILYIEDLRASMPNCRTDISREAWGVGFDRGLENDLWSSLVSHE